MAWGDDWSVDNSDWFAQKLDAEPGVFDIFAGAIQERVNAVFGNQDGGAFRPPLIGGNFGSECFAFSFVPTAIGSFTITYTDSSSITTTTSTILYDSIASLIKNAAEALNTAGLSPASIDVSLSFDNLVATVNGHPGGGQAPSYDTGAMLSAIVNSLSGSGYCSSVSYAIPGSGNFTINIGGTTTSAIPWSNTPSTLTADIQSSCDSACGSGNIVVTNTGNNYKLTFGGSYTGTSKVVSFDVSSLVNYKIGYAGDLYASDYSESGYTSGVGTGDAMRSGNFNVSGVDPNWSALQGTLVYIAAGFIPDGFTIQGSAPTTPAVVTGSGTDTLGYYPGYALCGPICTYSPTPYDPSKTYPLFPPDGWNRKFEKQIWCLAYPGSGRAWFSARITSPWYSCLTSESGTYNTFGTLYMTDPSEYQYSGKIMENTGSGWIVSPDQGSPVDVVSENLQSYQLGGGTGYVGTYSVGLPNFCWPGDIFDGSWLNDLQSAAKLCHTTQGTAVVGGSSSAKAVKSAAGVKAQSNSVTDASPSAAKCTTRYNTYAASPQPTGGVFAGAYAIYDASGSGSWEQFAQQDAGFNYVLQNTINVAGTDGTLNRNLTWWCVPEKFGTQFNDFGVGLTENVWCQWPGDGSGTAMEDGYYESDVFPASLPAAPSFPDGTTCTEWGWQAGVQTIVMEWQVSGGFEYQ
jgi:hypothetical protein